MILLWLLLGNAGNFSNKSKKFQFQKKLNIFLFILNIYYIIRPINTLFIF